MKKKISILTFAKGDNYGAVLQSYGLSTVLQRMGFEVEFIYLTWTTWQYALLSHITPMSYRFDKFRKRYLKHFSKKCTSQEELCEAVKGVSICIVGSDQVWNPGITTKRALHYFFDFLPDEIPCISYAASFGVSEWKWPELRSDVGNLLSKFSHISVREDTGVDICQTTFGFRAEKVLDPTLLLGDFKDVLVEPKHKDGVLGFKYAPSIEYYHLLRHIASKLDKKCVLMDNLSRKMKRDAFNLNLVLFPSPEQWVSNIAYSRLVVTDSFHCMAFAIIFKKDFIIIPSEQGKSLQARMTSLLRDLNLTNRLFSSIKEALESNIWNKSINYSEVNKRLSIMRKESMTFLQDALKEI